MNKHICGCLLGATEPEERCDEHRYAPCHTLETVWAEKVCPVCYRAKLMSLYLDRAATPTRRVGE